MGTHHQTVKDMVTRVGGTLVAAAPIGGPTVVIFANAACVSKLKKRGIDVVHMAKLRSAAAVSIVCFDKTCTFTVSQVCSLI